MYRQRHLTYLVYELDSAPLGWLSFALRLEATSLRKLIPTRGTDPPVYDPPFGISPKRLVISSERAKLSYPNEAESSLYTKIVRHLRRYKRKDTYPQDPYAFLGVIEVSFSLPTERSKVSTFLTVSRV